MQSVDVFHARLGQWLDGLEMPLLDDPRRHLEEQCLILLRNFFALLLASDPNDPLQTPAQGLERFAPGLAGGALYREKLALPLSGSPETVVSSISLDDFEGELSLLMEQLTDRLTDDGRLVILQLARLF